MPQVSVLIPTRNRKDLLRRTLSSYAQQSALGDILEVLVIDDGSTDGTAEMLAQYAKEYPVALRHFRQEGRGRAAACNYGIREAQGKTVLFGDDDILPSVDLVAQHLAWHKKRQDVGVGVMGYVAWSPEVHPTPFMEWLNQEGLQFHYASLHPGERIGFTSFYTCNTSLKLEFLRAHGLFDEEFRSYGYEDLELGFRLIEKAGLRVFYNPDAVGYHLKRVRFEDVCRKPQLLGPSKEVFARKEAGSRFFKTEATRKNSKKYRLQMLLARFIVPVLSPLKPLLDSPIPLPRALYRAFYAYYAYISPPPQ